MNNTKDILLHRVGSNMYRVLKSYGGFSDIYVEGSREVVLNYMDKCGLPTVPHRVIIMLSENHVYPICQFDFSVHRKLPIQYLNKNE